MLPPRLGEGEIASAAGNHALRGALKLCKQLLLQLHICSISMLADTQQRHGRCVLEIERPHYAVMCAHALLNRVEMLLTGRIVHGKQDNVSLLCVARVQSYLKLRIEVMLQALTALIGSVSARTTISQECAKGEERSLTNGVFGCTFAMA